MLSTTVAAGQPETLPTFILRQDERVQREFVFASNVPNNTTLTILRSAREILRDQLQRLYPVDGVSQASVLNVSYEDAGDRLIHWRVSVRLPILVADDPTLMTNLGADLVLQLSDISVKIRTFSLHVWSFLGWHRPPAKD